TLDIIKKYEWVVTKCISEKDEGISDAFNKGIKMATGDIVGIINSDDMLFEGALDKLNECYDPNMDVYYGNALIVNENGEKSHILNSCADLSGLPYSFCIVHPATFVAKKAYDKYGLFDKNLRCCMDYDLLLRFYKENANFKYINETLSVYRTGGTNQKLRRITIDECCQVSIRYGGNKIKVNLIKYKKTIADFIRPLAYKMGIHSKRVNRHSDI
ncbi:MAG: glycosyltransferase, partial [Clostridia bacterium]|nr:glycosyltransferase [Clostridia bacterium]